MFQPSDKVVCVDDRFHAIDRTLFSELPRRDRVYTVREFRCHDAGCGVLLHEITGQWCPAHRCEYGFRAIRFRKVTELTASTEEARARRELEPASMPP